MKKLDEEAMERGHLSKTFQFSVCLAALLKQINLERMGNMRSSIVLMRFICSVLALFFLNCVCLPASGQVRGITITIASMPTDPPGENMASEPIRGNVVGANPKEHKVVIYARGGDKWWVQPTVASPLTDIGADGSWESETHGGTNFAAIVVRASYKPQATLSSLPVIGGNILAMATKRPRP